MPGSIPNPLDKWQKWALQVSGTHPSFLEDLIDFADPITTSDDPSSGEWRHVALVFNDTVSGDSADTMITGIDIANITGGGLDSSWTSGDYTTVDGHLNTLVGNWLHLMDPGVTCVAYKYYKRSYNPYSDSRPFAESGPPEHVTTVALTGTAAGPLPHQVALASTEITPWPHHWGRMYWPAVGNSSSFFKAGGYLSDAIVVSWATSVHDAYDALQGDEFFPCVPTTTVNKTPSRQLLGVTAIQVDDIADIIRRRRAHRSSFRSVQPL